MLPITPPGNPPIFSFCFKFFSFILSRSPLRNRLTRPCRRLEPAMPRKLPAPKNPLSPECKTSNLRLKLKTQHSQLKIYPVRQGNRNFATLYPLTADHASFFFPEKNPNISTKINLFQKNTFTNGIFSLRTTYRRFLLFQPPIHISPVAPKADAVYLCA